MRKLNYQDALALTTEKLAHGGIFLTVKGETPNTMTIGWATIGHIWNRPVFMVLVRPQRHTYEMLKKAGEFTVSVPTKNPLLKELAFAGTKSGRDLNKFDGHGITAAKGQTIETPVIEECGLHFECKVVLTQDMTGERMDTALMDRCYPERDFHTMFFGEIVDCYTTDE
ncbi:MAG: flavin reductase family protein [Clostridiales bacterium]|nr:flavin reductase family protein [Clostridiales bacterium]